VMGIVKSIIESKIQQYPDRSHSSEEGEVGPRNTREGIVAGVKRLDAFVTRELILQGKTEMWNLRVGSAIEAHEVALTGLYDIFATMLEKSAGAAGDSGPLLLDLNARRQLSAAMQTKMELRNAMTAMPGSGLESQGNEPGERSRNSGEDFWQRQFQPGDAGEPMEVASFSGEGDTSMGDNDGGDGDGDGDGDGGLPGDDSGEGGNDGGGGTGDGGGI